MHLLWPPFWNTAGHYIFVLWCPLFFFLFYFFFLAYSQHSQCSTHLEFRSEMCCTRLAENARRKRSLKIRHLHATPPHKFVGLYLRKKDGDWLRSKFALVVSNLSVAVFALALPLLKRAWSRDDVRKNTENFGCWWQHKQRWMCDDYNHYYH